jgi:hypothetical protein
MLFYVVLCCFYVVLCCFLCFFMLFYVVLMFIQVITVANVRFNGNSVVGMRDHILDTIFSSTPYNIYNASTD